MSHLLELAGFTALTVAAWTVGGQAAGEAVGGVSLLVVAQGVDDGSVKIVVLRAVARLRSTGLRVLRRKKA